VVPTKEGGQKKYIATVSFPQKVKTFAVQQDILFVWTNSELSMPCLNSPATGHFGPISNHFEIFKPIEQGNTASSQSFNCVF
jgi:hypothetical protein